MDVTKWTYSEKVKDHFKNPRNLLAEGEKFISDGEGSVGSLACGDQMYVAIKVSDGKIDNIRWLTYGCASAIASTSIMSEMVKGMTLEQAYNVTPESIVRELDGLPEHKFHCSVLGDKALRAAIDNYLKKKGLSNPYKEKAAVVICDCKGVTDQDIEKVVADGSAQNFADVQRILGVATVCGKCRERAMGIFDEMRHIHGFV